ncbi:MAG: ABC transporter permease subunit, partial [Hylemonella sp.]
MPFVGIGQKIGYRVGRFFGIQFKRDGALTGDMEFYFGIAHWGSYFIPQLVSLRGIPYVVPVILVLLVGATFVLTRTSYGLHIYAVGGNAEAARRAGINVKMVR